MLQSHAQYKYLYNMFYYDFVLFVQFWVKNASKILTLHPIRREKEFGQMCFRRPITCYLDSKQLMMWVSNQLFSKCLCGNLNHSHVIVWKLIYQRVKWNSISMFQWDLISWNIFCFCIASFFLSFSFLTCF